MTGQRISEQISDEQLADWNQALINRHRVQFRTTETQTAFIARQAIEALVAARAANRQLQERIDAAVAELDAGCPAAGFAQRQRIRRALGGSDA